MTDDGERMRVRAQLHGWSASRWGNLIATAVIVGVIALVAVGAGAGTPARVVGTALLGVDAAAFVVALVMFFRRLSAERRQGYTTVEGFRIGAGVSLTGAPTADTVDVIDARTGVVLRNAGELDPAAEVLDARLQEARDRHRAGERPMLLDRLDG